MNNKEIVRDNEATLKYAEETLQRYTEYYEITKRPELAEAVAYWSTIVKALKKQIKKPMRKMTGPGYGYQCINGHNIPSDVSDHRMPYCPFCGQKLKYEKER